MSSPRDGSSPNEEFSDDYLDFGGGGGDYEVEMDVDPEKRQRTHRAMRRTLDNLEQEMGLTGNLVGGYQSSADESRSVDGSCITSDSALLAAPFPWRAIEGDTEDQSLLDTHVSTAGSVAAGVSTGQPPSLVMTPGLAAPRKSIFEGTSTSFEEVVSHPVRADAPSQAQGGVWGSNTKAHDPFNKPRVGKRSGIHNLLCFLFVFSVIMGTSIAIMMITQTQSKGSDTADASPSSSPTSRVDQGYLEMLANTVGDSIYAHNSPQKRAAEWITREDALQLKASDPTFLQRYLLAAFYFAVNDNGAHRWRSCGHHSDQETECAFDVLVRNKDDTLGYEPEISHRWLSERSECDWAGIVCHDNNVHGIHLAGQNITGPLPVEFTYLPTLQSVSLHYNDFSGEIPVQLVHSGYLVNLDLHGNRLTGTIPEEIYQRTRLEQLNLGENQLVGTVSPLVGKLTELKGLHVGNNYLSGSIPNEIGTLVSLTHTRWDNNRLEGTLPATIENLPNLEELWVQSNKLGGKIPPQLGVLQKMKDLQLYQNFFRGSIPDELYDLNGLMRLELSENDLTGTLSTRIGRLRALTDLRVKRNKLTGALPPQLGALNNLRILWLHQNRFVGAVPDNICTNTGPGFLEFLNADCGPQENPANPCTCCTGCCDRDTNICLITSNAFSNRF